MLKPSFAPLTYLIWIAALALSSGCNARDAGGGSPPSAELQARIDALAKKAVQDLRRVEGGSFWLGDFGLVMTDEEKTKNIPPGPNAQMRPGQLPFTMDTDNKPPRWVTLETFYLSAYKVTYGDFDVYVAAKGLPAHPPEGDEDWQAIWRKARTADDVPAGVRWSQAKGYCQWLGELTGLKFDLPTEAQWEFAASNRTNLRMSPYPTQSGMLDEGKAVPTFEQEEALRGRGATYPVGRFPPSPLGFHDLLSSLEWMEDWYSSDAYTTGPAANPRGPATGKSKVLRGKAVSDGWLDFRHLMRYEEVPDEGVYAGEPLFYIYQGVRCSVHQPDLQPLPGRPAQATLSGSGSAPPSMAR